MQENTYAQTITEDTLIGAIVEEHPEVIETLLSYGVHCIGCHVSPYESLGDGFRGHGLGAEEIKEAITALNAVIMKKTTPSEASPLNNDDSLSGDLSLTDLAAAKIKEICSQKNKSALRVAIRAGGCSGYEYSFNLDDEPQANDVVLKWKDAKVFVDQFSLKKMSGAIIDYHDGLTDAGFKIKNPQAASTCGCGNSFS